MDKHKPLNQSNPSRTPEDFPNLHPDAILSADIVSWLSRNMDGILAIINLDGEIEYVSDSVYPALGYQPQQVIGKQWAAFSGELNHNIMEEIRSVTKNKYTNLFIDLKDVNGEEVSFSCELNFISKENNNRELLLAFLQKNNENNDFEDLMIQSEKMNVAGQLAASLAHEIRNPLTSLKGFLQLLQAGAKHKEEYFNVMIEEVDKIESITSELLFISKPLTNERTKQKVTCMIQDVGMLLQSQANQKNIQIILESDTDAAIVCDRSQIKQVLINLVKNAIEAMEDQGKIIIRAVEAEDKVKLSIIDEGTGLPEEIFHRIGEPFFTTKPSGTGLGLLITKKILKNHGADFYMFNNEGKGSTFELLFPIEEE